MFTIIDNFLNKNEFNLIKKVFLSEEINWHYSKNIYQNIKETEFGHNFLCHMIYQNNQVVSPHFNLLQPILKKLESKALIRMKVNMYLNQGKYIEHRLHKDFLFKHKTALYHLNTNNGHTVIGDNRIESIENRIVLFDGSINHSSTNCTNVNRRLNINLNYF